MICRDICCFRIFLYKRSGLFEKIAKNRKQRDFFAFSKKEKENNLIICQRK